MPAAAPRVLIGQQRLPESDPSLRTGHCDDNQQQLRTVFVYLLPFTLSYLDREAGLAGRLSGAIGCRGTLLSPAP